MEKPSVFIADISDSFICQLSEELILDGTFDVSGTAVTGIETLEMIRISPPDMLVLDLLLPLKDGINILKELCTYPNPPVVITTSAFETDYLKELANKYGACCFIKKPCTIHSVIQNMKKNIHNNRIADPMLNSITLERDLTQLLNKLEISPIAKGYQYLKDAIMIAIFNPLAVTEIKKEIYIPLGKKYGLTAEHISLEIIKSISASVDHTCDKNYFQILGIHASAHDITAAELIATVSNKLLYRL